MRKILPVIVISQFLCTSVWFAGNAIMPDILRNFQVSPSYMGSLTSAVQFGFISGTLLFSVFTIADRFRPTHVFFACAVIAAFCNLAMVFNGTDVKAWLLFRFLTGFFLAGIYPVGMKIASDHYGQGLGKSLGFLVGALVLGTAFPHLLKTGAIILPWKYVILFTSALSVTGGLAMWLLVADGPYRRKSQRLDLRAYKTLFQEPRLRAAVWGYFGHMWELYAFWTFVPLMLQAYQLRYASVQMDIPMMSFLVIGVGSIACIAAGYLAQNFGAGKIASVALFISGTCCLLSPFFLMVPNVNLFLVFLFVWGFAVIADSPLLSAMVAANAPVTLRGSTLTLVTCIGFSITIVSIQLINALLTENNAVYIYMLLAIGPVTGFVALIQTKKRAVN